MDKESNTALACIQCIEDHMSDLAWMRRSKYMPHPGRWIVRGRHMLSATGGHERTTREMRPYDNRTILTRGGKNTSDGIKLDVCDAVRLGRAWMVRIADPCRKRTQRRKVFGVPEQHGAIRRGCRKHGAELAQI